jgi:DNA polymerase-3 subunit epsilon
VQLAFTTADELFALLEREGEALDYREVWPRLFPVTNCPPELMRALVADVVGGDERFVWESDVHVGLARWQATRRDLAEVAFTVVDIETTGSTPGFTKITEIGAVRIQEGAPVATFSALVNPRVPIPAMIVGLTGITQAMVAGAPPIQQVLPRFVEFAAGSVLVAHNARFDLGFLDYELGILQSRTFPRPALDTMRLARKLMPHMRCSLPVLAQRFDTAVKPSHRALPDAQATAELLLIFLARLQEQGVTTLEEVARFCEPQARRNYHKIVLTERLPAAPGVYIMRDDRGQPLYIGKAESLRRRTRDHFLQKQAYGARQALELLERIDVVQTGSEFEALLLETQLIGEHRPPYNDHGTRVAGYTYVKLTNEEFPRLYATPNLIDDGALYAGPFRKASLARRFVDCMTSVYPLRTCTRLPKASAGDTDGEGAAGTGDAARRAGHACQRFHMGACLAPCRAQLDGEYAEVVGRIRRVLHGDGRHLDDVLQRRQAALVAALAFEQAARVQDHRDIVAQAIRAVRHLRESVSVYAVLAYPAREPGVVKLWGVAAGSIVARAQARPQQFALADAEAFLQAVYRAEAPAPPLPPEAIDEILLVGGWLRRHRQAPNALMLPAPADEASAAALTAAARQLLKRLPLCAGA